MNNPHLLKTRSILFARFPPGQIPEAADDLARLGGIAVTLQPDQRTLTVSYDLSQYALQDIERHLEDKGYHLDNSLFCKLTRALVHYLEETQLHNLAAPEKRLKRSSAQAYVKAWEHHPHGDHDDTPPEWRSYR